MKWYTKRKYMLMKKLIFSLIVFCAISLSGFSQNIDFVVKIDSIPSIAKVNITISISKGEPDYVYSIATDAPWKGGTIIKESAIQTEKKYTFENIPYGKYFIMVRDKSNEKASYQYVIVPTPK